MKKIITLTAMLAFIGSAFANEGNTLLEDASVALNASANYSGSSYN